MVHIISKSGMKKGYWKIEKHSAPGFVTTVRSGLGSKKGAEEIARRLDIEEGNIDLKFSKRRR